MKERKTKNAGFTLIELMIVFVIIIVLAGMVLRLMGLASSRNAEAVTRERLERVAQALEEFRAIYGRYPPVDYYPGGSQPTEYEYSIEGPRSMPESVKSQILSRSKKDNIWDGGEEGYGRVFTFGLLSYFFPRYKSHAEDSPDEFIGRRPGTGGDFIYDESKAINQWYKYNERTSGEEMADIIQNIESARRILPYLDASLNAEGKVEKYGIVTSELRRRHLDENDQEGYMNQFISIRDGWLRSINYQSRPPYDSYKLWSSGPDGRTGKVKHPTTGVVTDYSEDDIILGEG